MKIAICAAAVVLGVNLSFAGESALGALKTSVPSSALEGIVMTDVPSAERVRLENMNKMRQPEELNSSAPALDRALQIARAAVSAGDARVEFKTKTDEEYYRRITKASFKGLTPGTKKACSIIVTQHIRDTGNYTLSLYVLDTDPASGRHNCDESMEHDAYGRCMRDLKATTLGAGASYADDITDNDREKIELRDASTVPHFLGWRDEATLEVSDKTIVLEGKFVATPFQQDPGSDEVFNWNNVRHSDSMACEFKVKQLD